MTCLCYGQLISATRKAYRAFSIDVKAAILVGLKKSAALFRISLYSSAPVFQYLVGDNMIKEWRVGVLDPWRCQHFTFHVLCKTNGEKQLVPVLRLLRMT